MAPSDHYKIDWKESPGQRTQQRRFSVMADIAVEKGVFEESESKIIKNLMNFKSVLAKDIMTPRVVEKTFSEDQRVIDFFNQNKNLPFTRIPIYKDYPDNITGYVLKDDILREAADDKHALELKDLKRNIIINSNNISIPVLFQKFTDEKEHISLIVDEYGSIMGIVTMEDVIETLLGLEIIDEYDTHADLQKLARKNWEQRAKKHGLLDN